MLQRFRYYDRKCLQFVVARDLVLRSARKQKFVAEQFNCWVTSITHDALQAVAERRSALFHTNVQITAGNSNNLEMK
jgi:fructose/tagatose bisphosphate aldolase